MDPKPPTTPDLTELARELAEDLDDRGGESLTRSGGIREILSTLTRAFNAGVEAAAKKVNAARPCPIEDMEQAIADDALKAAESAIRSLLTQEGP